MSERHPITESDLHRLVVVLGHHRGVDGLVGELIEIRHREGRISEGLVISKDPYKPDEKGRWFPLSHLIGHENLKALSAPEGDPEAQRKWYGK